MIKILANSSVPSAKLLSTTLQTKTGESFLVTRHPEKINGRFIRYGNSSNSELDKNVIGNTSQFIRVVSFKKLFSDILIANDVFSPMFNYHPTELQFPLIVRETLSGYGGVGIHVIENNDQFNTIWRSGFYWTPFVHMEFELRLHVVGGQIARVFKKVKADGNEESFPIRNMDKGYHFSLRNPAEYSKAQTVLNRINEVLDSNGFDHKKLFYALDVGWTKDKGYFILEANSAPGLNEHTAESYADFIISLLG